MNWLRIIELGSLANHLDYTSRHRAAFFISTSSETTMQQDSDLAGFIGSHVEYALQEADLYATGAAIAEYDAVNVIALALFKFVAISPRDVATAEKAEAEFRERAAVIPADTETAN